MAVLPPDVMQQFFDNDGDPLALGKVYTYIAQTTTPKDTYTNSGAGTANANPVVLDSSGRANIWLGNGDYKFIVKDAADSTIKTVDNIPGASNNLFGYDVQAKSSNFNITATEDNVFFDCTASLTASLLAAATAGEGFIFAIYNSSASGVVTVDPDSSETINGASTLLLYPGNSAIILCDGSKWYAMQVQGPSQSVAKSADYTASAGDEGKLLLVDSTSAAVTITLPAVATAGNGFEIAVKKTDSSVNSVIVDGFSTETIDGQNTYTLSGQWDAVILKAGATGWYIKNRSAGAVASKTTTYTISAGDNDRIISCDATSAAFTVTLPAVANVYSGFKVTVKKTDSSANAVTVDGDGAETIEGIASVLLRNKNDCVTLVSNGTSWLKVGVGAFNVSVFTASGTWTNPGCTRARVTVVAGGGGGGHGSGENGGNGGSSSFGSHCSATGGSGGPGNGTTSSIVAGGAGGAGSSGDENISGRAGGYGYVIDLATDICIGGNGGDSYRGTGGRGSIGLATVVNAGVGVGYGAGGGGATGTTTGGSGGGGGGTAIKTIATGLGATETVTVGAAGTAPTINSAAGTAGIVIVEEYI